MGDHAQQREKQRSAGADQNAGRQRGHGVADEHDVADAKLIVRPSHDQEEDDDGNVARQAHSAAPAEPVGQYVERLDAQAGQCPGDGSSAQSPQDGHCQSKEEAWTG